ncbi:hypothetical protein RJ641_027883, partial [Dillenia turbinata]
VPGMEYDETCGGHLTSAATFVEGGIQEAYEDACSICLEAFSDNEPATVSMNYYACCDSRELLEAVASERSFRLNSSRTPAIFHHPVLGDFDLSQLHVGSNYSDFEEHLLQHLASAAAMGRAHHIAQMQSQRTRSSGHGCPQFLVLSLQLRPVQSLLASGFSGMHAIRQGIVVANGFMNQPSEGNESRPGPSDFQSFSESLKSRLSSASMRYKESISKSTRGLKERWFSRSPSMADIGSEVRREVSAGIASVSRVIEQLESNDCNGANSSSVSNSTGSSVAEPVNPNNAEANETALSGNNTPPCATSSMPH